MYFCKGGLYVAKVITLGLQKGGVSKTTTAGILAYLMAKDKKKVLAVDMDSQGNLTELLTEEPANNFIDRSVFEAIAYKDPKSYIYLVNNFIDLLPANNFLASFGRWIYLKKIPGVEKSIPYSGKPYEQLDLTLKMIQNNYDYILIDTPPSLSEQTTNALIASNYCLIPYESSRFCYSALPNFLETVEFVQQTGSNDLKILGISRTLNDKRRNDAKFFNDKVAEDYPDLVLDVVITRKATIGRIPLYGFNDNNELNEALPEFNRLYKEILTRLGELDNE